MNRFLTASNQENVFFFSKNIFFLLLSAELYHLNLIIPMVICMLKPSASAKLVQCFCLIFCYFEAQNDIESSVK